MFVFFGLFFNVTGRNTKFLRIFVVIASRSGHISNNLGCLLHVLQCVISLEPEA